MNKLIIDRIEFRNFLSFGNTWQTFVFNKGMSLVRGIDYGTKKSNGSGKSSLVELLPFALFGQTIKDIKKNKISNWYNNTKCEIKLYFTINDNEYYFYRSIKPNKFIVYKNDELIPQLSNVRDFQIKINEDIIGMDFKTFSKLIYFSPNNTISILDAKKEQKRKFLESLFDLKEYSEMLRLCNPKIKDQRSKVSIYENNLENILSNIESLKTDIRDSITVDIKPLRKDRSLFKLKLDGLNDIDIQFDQLKYDQTVSRVKTLTDDMVGFVSQKKDIDTQMSYEQKILDSYDIQSVNEQHQQVDIKISTIQEDILSIDITDINKQSVDIKDKFEQIDLDIAGIQENINKYTKLSYKLQSNIERTNDDIQNIDNKDRLGDIDNCPLCRQNIDHDMLYHYYLDEKQSLLELQFTTQSSFDKVNVQLDKWDSKIKVLSDEKSILIKEYHDLLDKITDVEHLKDKLGVLQDYKNSLQDIDVITNKYNITYNKLKDLDTQLLGVIHKITMTETDQDLASSTLKLMDINKIKKEKNDNDINELTLQINNLDARISDLEKIQKKDEDRINKKRDAIVVYEGEADIIQKNIKKVNILIDYLEYIKISLKDENIKQYAISSLLPFLNKQTNYYLSESGFPYRVDIDGWLDVKIKGFGVDDVGYSSLSGGERKSIDISIQFACNDMAALQASSIIDVGIYDEILDSSLDEQSLMPIINIIKIKQQNMDLCVYVITHKNEINELDFDNYINIEKNNGFSKIIEV